MPRSEPSGARNPYLGRGLFLDWPYPIAFAHRGARAHARENTLEELAREQIAKIVDRLKGLKERQDGFTQESERLHKTVLQNQKWLREPILSLSASLMLAASNQSAAWSTFSNGQSVENRMRSAPISRMASINDCVRKLPEVVR